MNDCRVKGWHFPYSEGPTHAGTFTAALTAIQLCWIPAPSALTDAGRGQRDLEGVDGLGRVLSSSLAQTILFRGFPQLYSRDEWEWHRIAGTPALRVTQLPQMCQY